MKPGYINIGAEVKGFDCKTLVQKMVEAFKNIGKWLS